jgi:hypothetical protein
MWQRPLHIEITQQPAGPVGKVAQYYGLEDAAAVEKKLAQFPKGTQFVLVQYGAGTSGIVQRIRAFAAENGLMLTDGN